MTDDNRLMTWEGVKAFLTGLKALIEPRTIVVSESGQTYNIGVHDTYVVLPSTSPTFIVPDTATTGDYAIFNTLGGLTIQTANGGTIGRVNYKGTYITYYNGSSWQFDVL